SLTFRNSPRCTLFPYTTLFRSDGPQVMDIFEGIDAHWVWLTLGLILAALEMLVPGVYLIWLALAAIATGVLTFAFDLSVPMQVRSEEHTSELQSRENLVCRLLL